MNTPVRRALRAWLLFEGRIARVGLLLRFCLAFLVLMSIEFLLGRIDLYSWSVPFDAVAPILFYWVFMGLQIRRLHDLSIHGSWLMLPWLTVLIGSWLSPTRGLIAGDSSWFRCVLLPFWMLLLLLPGKADSNRFGAPMRGV